MVVTGTMPVFNLTMDGNSQVTKLVITCQVECFYVYIQSCRTQSLVCNVTKYQIFKGIFQYLPEIG